ncbi:MAG: hypothetical protein M3Q33_13425 [Acidobacteriota bacterium]|nr:hypothetical protein [Acidobacteriota bacterium]
MMLPPASKFRFSTWACDRLCSPAPCVLALSSPVVSAPPKTFADIKGAAVIEPPAVGKPPVSTRVAFVPL